MRLFRPLAPALLVLVLAACTGAAGASPSAEPSRAPSSAPSAAPSEAPSAAPSAEPSASAAATRVDVVGTDYAFSEFGPTFDGPVTFAFRNEGDDLHEMVVVRKKDGVTESFQDLLALPEEEVFAKIDMVGVIMAEKGQTGPDMVTASAPGAYLMICFIPQGTKTLPSQDPNASGPPTGLGDGPPHMALGMLREFSISE